MDKFNTCAAIALLSSSAQQPFIEEWSGEHLALSVNARSICHCDLRVELASNEANVVCYRTPRAARSEQQIAAGDDVPL